ncbi:hypothetical protein I3842_06G072600 [Carya illinoinensis]|uniref:Uncharacterized protein n=1 Tax=Carya illinoinensis TaxID=32201 RepID=A0A922EVC2_CARIL|nr:hypothetical protein I3842_06G072600 [Carya illinoinensis]
MNFWCPMMKGLRSCHDRAAVWEMRESRFIDSSVVAALVEAQGLICVYVLCSSFVS